MDFMRKDDTNETPAASGSDTAFSIDDVLDEVRREVQRLIRRGVDYKRVFRSFDRAFDGVIHGNEFKTALEELGISLSSSQLKQIMTRFAGRRGHLKYRDFLNLVAPEDAAEVDVVTRKLRRMVADHSRRGRRMDFKKTFRHFDREREGSVSAGDFRAALEDLGFELSDNEFWLLLDKFDSDGDGRVTYAEFMDFMRKEEDVEETAQTSDSNIQAHTSDSHAQGNIDESQEPQSYEGLPRARGLADDEALVITLTQLKLDAGTRRSTKKVAMVFEFLEHKPHRTASRPVSKTRNAVSLNFTKSKLVWTMSLLSQCIVFIVAFPVSESSAVTNQLKDMLSQEAKGEIIFSLRGDGPGSPELGAARFNIHSVLDGCKDFVHYTIPVQSMTSNKKIGDLVMSFTALSTLTRVLNLG
jgi:Ca2+-binding EF-hand superfamily protein